MAATRTKTATIASGATTSNSIDLDNYATMESLMGLVMPAAFTGASISFNVSNDDSTYQQLYNSANAAVSISITAAKNYGFSNDVCQNLRPWRFIQIVSASSEGAERTITLIRK